MENGGDANASEIEKYNDKQIEEIKDKFIIINKPTKLFQQSDLATLHLITNKMLEYYMKYNEFQDPKLYASLMKVKTSHENNIRKQDEGIKLNADMNITHDEFRKIIDVEAKKIEDEELDWMEKKYEKNNKRNNSSNGSKSKTKHTDNRK